jgi:hypothetical protein
VLLPLGHGRRHPPRPHLPPARTSGSSLPRASATPPGRATRRRGQCRLTASSRLSSTCASTAPPSGASSGTSARSHSRRPKTTRSFASSIAVRGWGVSRRARRCASAAALAPRREELHA